MSVPSIKIISVFHKAFPHSESPLYLNIHVGRALSNQALPFEGDDTGDHISELNPFFCELTALYWLWKNKPLPDFVGLCHYRRYFDLSRSWYHTKKEQKTACDLAKIASDKGRNLLLKDLQSHDIILPRRIRLKRNIEDDYIYHHIKEEWLILMNTLKEKYPTDYEVAAQLFTREQHLHPYNMFITSRVVFQSYMTWLFDILMSVNSQLKRSEYPYQKRSIGFMAERLLNLYVKTRGLRVKERPVVFFTE